MNTTLKSKIFLGIDGGQSHTEALIADESGNILGIGYGGALNHGNLPDGRERLKTALQTSVGEALKKAYLPPLNEIIFASAHCGMTGGADYKEEIIRQTLQAKDLAVGHDALTALYGATAGKPGIIVIAGTGSIVFGINEKGAAARAGGLGYIFSDEGSGFWLAVRTIKLAIKEQDGVIPENGLHQMVLDFFKVREIRELTNAFYNAQISRDCIAGFAETISKSALAGNKILEDLIESGAKSLVENVKGAAKQLNFTDNFQVSTVGGMFRGELMKRHFCTILHKEIPTAIFTEPRFGPAIGALLLAYQKANIEINDEILTNLKNDC